MSLKGHLRPLLVCALLQVGALQGAPMRAEQIQELMRQLNQPKLAHVLPSENDDGHGPPEEPDGVELDGDQRGGRRRASLR